MRKGVIHLAFALFFLTILISTACAGNETQITHGMRLTLDPSIYGNIVVWGETATNGISMYNLTTGNMTFLGYWEDGLSIHGDKIALWGYDGVIVYNISTGREINIEGANRAAVYGDNLVYERSVFDDCQPPNYQYTQYNSLFLYNLSTKKEAQLTNYEPKVCGFAIYGDKIVWVKTNESTRFGNVSICDIPTKRISDISLSGRAGSPDIYGNIVVWTEDKDGTTNIYMRDIAKHKTSQIYSNWTGTDLSIYGNRLVWMNESGVDDSYHSDIYMYDISTTETTRITNSTYASEPEIYDDKIVYIDSRNDTEYQETRDVYIYNLTA